MTKVSSENTLLNNSPNYTIWFSRLLLMLIVLFAIFLRYENFSAWKKNKNQFQYQGEYQMANFDSYYYLQIAKELQNGDYDNLQENRRVPNGMQTPTIPPLIAVFAVSISNLTGIPISTVAIFLPIFLASLLAPLVFLLSLKFRFNKFAALTAALFSIISLTYVIRTRIGVFDTDCLNVIFVLLNSYLFFCFAEIKNNKRYVYLTLGLLSSFLFFIWWNTATSIVILSAIVPLSVALIFYYKTKKTFVKYSLLALTLLISFYAINEEITSLFNFLLHKTNDAFPNNLSISELNKVNISEFIKKTTGSTTLFLFMLVGVVSLCWKLKIKALFLAIPLVLAISPLFIGNRFIIFSAPVLALGIGYCIQILSKFKQVKPKLAIFITLIIVIIGVSSNYKTITDKYEKPAAYENTALLNALNKHTPKGANIWTNWDTGYQIQYYLDRGTYADGGIGDGEITYYVSFPLAVSNLNVSANFMRFYNKHGLEGMETLYQSFTDVAQTFKFLKTVFAYNPSKAEQWLTELETKKALPKTNHITTPQQWVSFLFPRKSDDIYILIHYKMTQTAGWFKQGNSDLKTKKTKGLPLFLTFNSLKEQGNQIKNNQINLNSKTGIATYFNQSRSFQSLSTFDGISTKTTSFGKKRGARNFVFQWNKKIGFGAAMSPEMANTTLVKLFLLQQKSSHFQPVSINTPFYQIWKVTGNAYD